MVLVQALAFIVVVLILFRGGHKVEELISKARLHLAFAHLIAKGNIFVIVALSAMSIIVISGFKFAATFQDSVAIARWVMLQSILAAFILFLNGVFVVTIITIFPVLPAVFAMENRLSSNTGWTTFYNSIVL
ncbi:unnamed protein product [Ilex paraguariensis]|uniref:Uncharacterized protein n=1 Tax=Ilex paraguariensis TaxID=185542 RepID=A0ABC8SMR4_9AQUA